MTTTLTGAQTQIVERYTARTPRARELFDRARRSLPAGSTRSLNSWQPHPIYVTRAAGTRVTDVDGNVYLDFLNNYSSLVLGHAHPAVIAALSERLGDGTAFSYSNPLEVDLAERICERIPSVELVRFTNSGLEATLYAIKIARAASGRDRIAKFEGGYHGTHDAVLVSVRPPLDQAGPRDAPHSVADAAGVSRSAVEEALVLPFNNLEATTRLLHANRDTLAAVILEPVLGSGGVIPPAPGFLAGLREVTRELGLLLIFDEVISLRLAPGGAQEYYGVIPDLTAMGKLVGGGMPVGAYGGRADLMSLLEPSGIGEALDFRGGGPKIYQGGTFTGNPLTMAAGLATLDQLTPSEYHRLNALGERLQSEVTRVCQELDAPVQVSAVGSLFNIHFTREPMVDARAPRSADGEMAHLFFLEMLNRGFILAPRGMGALSTPTEEADVDAFVEAMRGALHLLYGNQQEEG